MTRSALFPSLKFLTLAFLTLAFCALTFITGCGKNATREITSRGNALGDSGIFVKKVEGLSRDFLMGVDISSVLALEKSGVVFRNARGESQDIFKTLKEYGINSIRVRVWNKPFTEDGNGYGGGNCDINTAIEIGRRAAAYDIPILLDFHYSDFWADPSKQQAPRAWTAMSLEKKEEALYAYTKESLDAVLKAGVDVHMVQLGNETTGSFCGEKNWIAIARLMNAGAKAVREIAKEKRKKIEIAIHFTNPEKEGEYERYAKILEKQKVDYDIFASSWYPYWHGSAENFSAVLKRVAEISGKKVMCAEISWAYTPDDGDGFQNTISADTACAKPYSFTVQGQADAVRDAINAVSSIGKKGIGVYYWEPAWLPVPGKDASERSVLWEKFGSGWASSYAAEYDPADAGVYFGGTSWDNQAMFGFDGTPLASLAVWKLVRKGAVTTLRPDSVQDTLVRTRIGDAIILSEEATVLYNDGTSKNSRIIWDAEGTVALAGTDYGKTVSLADMSGRGVGEYSLYGIPEGTDKNGSTSVIKALAKISIVEQNYLDNGGFEESDIGMWKIVNAEGKTSELGVQDKPSDAKSGNKSFHFWSKDKVAFSVEQTVTELAPGIYKFSLAMHGGDAKNQVMYIYAISGGKEYRAEAKVDGWRNFFYPTIAEIPVSDGKVTVGASIACDANGWGSLDDFSLSPIK